MDYLTILLNVLEILVALVALSGTAYGIYKWLVTPLKNIMKNIEAHTAAIENITNTITDKVLPIINSLNKEFSVNSGKSIKDQINRIDDATRLAELRSKLIASNLLTTGAYECDAQGLCTWVNNALCELYGLTEEQMLGNGWLAAVDESERAEVWNQWHENIKLDIPHESKYTIYNRKTRETFKVRTTAITHRTNDGKVLAYYGTTIRL